MDGAWVEVRESLNKRTMNRLMGYMPKRKQEDIKKNGITVEEGTSFQVGLFEALVTAWSDESIAPTGEAYLGLEIGPEVDELDQKLMEFFEGLVPTKEEQGKP